MRTLRSALLALAVAIGRRIGTGTASAATVVIDSVDHRHRRSSPPTSRSTSATPSAGSSTSCNDPHGHVHQCQLVARRTARPQRRADLARRSTPPGVYTFLCKVHTGMTGSVTVATRRATSSTRSSSSRRTAGFRHDSIPQGIAVIQELGAANGFTVDRDRGPDAVHRRQPRAVRRRRLPVDDQRRPQRRAADRVRALHPGRRRLRRHPRRDRHRVHVALVRPDARRLLPQPPGRHADRDRPHRGHQRALHDRHPGPWSARRRVVQLPAADQPGGQRRRQRLLAARQRREGARDGRRVDLRRGRRQHHRRRSPGRVVHRLRRRPRLVHRARPHAGLLLRGRRSAPTSSAASGPPRAPSPPTAARRARPRRRPTTSRSPRSTTTPRARWSSPSPRTAACFYVERITGEVNLIKANGDVVTAGRIPVSRVQENGLLGIALDPNFATNDNFYVAYTPLPDTSTKTRVAASRSPATRSRSRRSGRSSRCNNQRDGVLPLRPARSPSASTATCTCRPATTPTRSPRTASTRSTSAPGRAFWDAQRTSANTNSYSGKILRIQPLANPTGAGRRHGLHDPGRQPVRRGRGHAEQDAARDLRDGLPQPVPDHGRSDTRARS